MGLDVAIFENVTPHFCETRKPRDTHGKIYLKNKMWPDKQMYMFTPDDNVEEEFIHDWSPYEEFYTCDCESENVFRISPGFVSCLDIVKYPYFGPYEFEGSDSFYFGAYSKFARLRHFVPALEHCTSDCDGSYGGCILIDLRDQLEEAKSHDPVLQSYFDLLDGKDLSNCIVKHF